MVSKTEKEKRMDRIDLPIPIAVDLIDPSPFPGRITVDDSKMEELIMSIRQLGILQNLVVRRKPPGRYELVIGSRRLHAAKKIGMTTVLCMIKDLTDGEVQRQQLSENIERGDFTDYEIALKLESMLKNSEEYPTQEVLGFSIGKTQSWIAHKLRMLQLRTLCRIGIMLKLPSHHVEAILEAPPEKRPEIVKRIEKHIETEDAIPSVREIQEFAKGAVPTSETPILQSTIKHEGVEVQRTSEESKDESCAVHDNESIKYRSHKGKVKYKNCPLCKGSFRDHNKYTDWR
jgi:ParB/RepB/Spo0J family partition protein